MLVSVACLVVRRLLSCLVVLARSARLSARDIPPNIREEARPRAAPELGQ